MNPAESAGRSTGSAEQDLLQAVKSAFPDVSVMPAEIRAVVERQTVAQEQPQAIQALRKATTRLDKNQKLVKSLKDSQLQHRQSWQAHLTQLLTSWKSQLQEFEDQQASYQQRIVAAKEEIADARNMIQKLNTQLGSTAEALPTLEERETTEDQVGQDIKQLQQQASEIITRAVTVSDIPVVDLESPEPETKVMDTEEDDGRPKERSPKRAKSIEPFGGPPPIGAHASS